MERGKRIYILLIFVIFHIGQLKASHLFKIGSDTSYWHANTEVGLFCSQSAYSSYTKEGGVKSLAFNARAEFNMDYKKARTQWANRVEGRIGMMKQGNYEFIKNEDRFELVSKYNHKFNKHWRISGLLNFRTNYYDTYAVKKTGEKGKRVGDFLSPAYLDIGSGIDFVLKEKVLVMYYTPINSKITYVRNDSLRSQFLQDKFVSSGTRYELGSLFRLVFEKEVMKNVTMRTISTLFANHMDSFGKIDVNIESRINLKINKLLSANILARVIYDEDVLFDLRDDNGELTGKKGPRTQFSEVFNIGLSQKF